MGTRAALDQLCTLHIHRRRPLIFLFVCLTAAEFGFFFSFSFCFGLAEDCSLRLLLSRRRRRFSCRNGPIFASPSRSHILIIAALVICVSCFTDPQWWGPKYRKRCSSALRSRKHVCFNYHAKEERRPAKPPIEMISRRFLAFFFASVLSQLQCKSLFVCFLEFQIPAAHPLCRITDARSLDGSFNEKLALDYHTRLEAL